MNPREYLYQIQKKQLFCYDLTMTKRRPKPATYQDLLRVPEHLVVEIIEGELITSPRPASPHAHAESVMGIDVGSSFHGGSSGRRGPGG